MQYLFGFLMFATALFLIMLVLVQRGRGGGLAGALGGMGGQSAFGAKAGDTFTKITIYVSTFWILLCMVAVVVMNRQHGQLGPAEPEISGSGAATAPVDGAGETEGGAADTGGGGAASDESAED